jgi:hypothetical protein
VRCSYLLNDAANSLLFWIISEAQSAVYHSVLCSSIGVHKLDCSSSAFLLMCWVTVLRYSVLQAQAGCDDASLSNSSKRFK